MGQKAGRPAERLAVEARVAEAKVAEAEGVVMGAVARAEGMEEVVRAASMAAGCGTPTARLYTGS